MLVIELKSWQEQDGTFARVEPNFRVVHGPPGVSIVVLIANRTVTSLNRFHSYEGFARIYRISNTGFWDYRLFNFVTTLDSVNGRRGWNLNVGFRGGDDGDLGEGTRVRRRLVDEEECVSDGEN